MSMTHLKLISIAKQSNSLNLYTFVAMQQHVNIKNKRARFEYEILDTLKAGIVLSGTEIKSIRNSRASIAESFCEFNEKRSEERRVGKDGKYRSAKLNYKKK